MCDVPFCDNSPPLDVLTDHFEIFFDFNDDCTLSKDDSFEDIDYVKASPPDFKLVSLKEVKDEILRAKLLNIHLLIDKIESLNNNPTSDCVLKSPFSSFLSYSNLASIRKRRVVAVPLLILITLFPSMIRLSLRFSLIRYPVIRHPPQETSEEMLQARENLMLFIQTFLKKFNRISFRETPKVLMQAWDKFFEIQHAQPEDTLSE
uniref:Reverse transcriptase domain-containing protein n=1 Tax=Tanacetum cinerariifolium TaxID=118510 RepID=A0A699RFF6_TANCI|nr:hypothetical protein [Tanacetum cinerariifolium]